MSIAPLTNDDSSDRFLSERTLDCALIFCAVGITSLLGIWSRSLSFLAVFWPANAVLLGVMLRRPGSTRWHGWLAAIAAYLAADLATGSDLTKALMLTAANLAGVIVAVALYARLDPEYRRLRRQLSALHMFWISLVASAVAGMVGALAAVHLFDSGLLSPFLLWFGSEWVSQLLILPVMLTAPRLGLKQMLGQAWHHVREAPWMMTSPVLALAASQAAGVLIDGPGSITFIVPALLWCAMTYNLFTTTVLSLVVCTLQMVFVSAGLFFLPINYAQAHDTFSLRSGIALLSLGPLAAAVTNNARLSALRKLQHALLHDSLTGVLARAAFMAQAGKLLARAEWSHNSTSVLMLDVDHFKQVNDRHGHAGGDVVLREFAELMRSAVRPGDLVGRLGGEEFAAILPNTTREEAHRVGERIRHAVDEHRFSLPNGAVIQVSVSVGLCMHQASDVDDFARVLARADSALYRAKALGRNRVIDSDTLEIPA